MTDPIVFSSRNRIREGMLEDVRRHYGDSVPLMKADKPGTLVQLAYINEDVAEVTIVRVFPSAEALDRQLQGTDERSRAACKFIEPTSVEIYGTPNSYAREQLKQIAGSSVNVSVAPQLVGGFIRVR